MWRIHICRMDDLVSANISFAHYAIAFSVAFEFDLFRIPFVCVCHSLNAPNTAHQSFDCNCLWFFTPKKCVSIRKKSMELDFQISWHYVFPQDPSIERKYACTHIQMPASTAHWLQTQSSISHKTSNRCSIALQHTLLFIFRCLLFISYVWQRHFHAFRYGCWESHSNWYLMAFWWRWMCSRA